MLTTTDLRWAQATTPPTLAGQLGPASYSTRPLTPLSLLLLPFFSGQTAIIRFFAPLENDTIAVY
ncbi:hypothetical protein KFU94_61170 [Chloroflexi bacterium TSY]|nr:hypothetical protein [Chloroflexi bacterium TSY]